jgi:hypothetical protein
MVLYTLEGKRKSFRESVVDAQILHRDNCDLIFRLVGVHVPMEGRNITNIMSANSCNYITIVSLISII